MRELNATLSGALKALLPETDETLLLRACLLHDARGVASWNEFTRDHRDLTELFRTDKGELKRLGPLLGHGLNASNASAEARLWTVLRTGRMREGLRGNIYQQVLRDVLNALRTDGIPNLVIRGAATGELAYEEMALRHSHDIDLLIEPDCHAAAITAICSIGFTPAQPVEVEGGRRNVVELIHKTSLPVRIHSTLFELQGYETNNAALAERSMDVQLAGTTARVLSPADMLLQTLGHATYSSTRYSIQWAADAFKIIERFPELDWNQFAAGCDLSRTSLPVLVLAGYLTDELQIGIPVSIREMLVQSAMSSPFARDLALYGARAGAKAGLSALFTHTTNFSDRVRLAAWLLKPSAEYVRWAEGSATTLHRGGSVGRLVRYARQRMTPTSGRAARLE